MNRRRFLTTATMASGALTARPLMVPTVEAQPTAAAQAQAPADPTKVLGRPVSDYGARSRFETAVRVPFATKTKESSWTFTPLQDSVGIITPSALHFERHHAGVPDIDPSRHRLLIHGLVKRSVVLSMGDIHRLPSASRVHMIECSGNGLTEWAKPTMKDVQGTHGLTSCSEWTGVLLCTILDDLGLEPNATWIVAEGADGAAMTRSLPMAKCLADGLVAYGQNGEALRPEQGYPLRLVVPGYEGNTHIKWLRRIKVVSEPYQTREETSKYTDLMPDGTARQFTFEMEAKSVITFPSANQQLAGPGFWEISGLAWSGRGYVRRVEVSTDAGRSWRDAILQDPIHRIAHTRFRSPWRWDGAETIVQSRCTDDTGYVQPTLAQLVRVRGLNSVYHLNAIQSWKIARDGRVSNVHA